MLSSTMNLETIWNWPIMLFPNHNVFHAKPTIN